MTTVGPSDLVSLPTAAVEARVQNQSATIPRWKRAFDLGVGALALVVLSPVMTVAACFIFATSSGPVLFRQTRIGHAERAFTMFKFRTMYDRAQSDAADREAFVRELRGEATPEPGSDLFRPVSDPRVTPAGRFLRRFSIDELPQLLNVIRGDMSLVGPRPSLPWEDEFLTDRQRRRYESPPGLTGLWQVRGRNRVSSREMLELDIQYVEQRSLKLDLAILLSTPRAVLFDRNTR